MGALVIGGSAIARSIASGLGSDGRAVLALDDPALLEDPAALAGVLADAHGRGPIELVVHAQLDESGFLARPIIDLSEHDGVQACERALRQAVIVLQQVHEVLDDGASVVIVLPSIGSVGAAGLVPLCSAIEGIRVMAKALARRWGARSITVNTIEVDLGAFMLAGGDAAAGTPAVPAVPVLGSPALPEGSVADDVLGLIEFFASPAGHAVTGALLVADRGMVMLP